VFGTALLVSTLCLLAFLFFPPNAAGTVVLTGMLHGFFYGITTPILWSMVADVADFSEWRNNRRATAIVFSAIMVGLKIGLAVGGALVAETRPPRPQTERARRRADAERQLREWGRRSGVRVSILRVPGIYAADRLPLARLRSGTPALRADEDAYVNHVHADDLARIVVAALHRGGPGRMYNAADDAPIRMGDYFDLVADRFGLPHPPRVSRAEADQLIAGNLRSFMGESRRLVNRRLKEELGVRLRYPTVHDGVPQLVEAA